MKHAPRRGVRCRPRDRTGMPSGMLEGFIATSYSEHAPTRSPDQPSALTKNAQRQKVIAGNDGIREYVPLALRDFLACFSLTGGVAGWRRARDRAAIRVRRTSYPQFGPQ